MSYEILTLIRKYVHQIKEAREYENWNGLKKWNWKGKDMTRQRDNWGDLDCQQLTGKGGHEAGNEEKAELNEINTKSVKRWRFNRGKSKDKEERLDQI